VLVCVDGGVEFCELVEDEEDVELGGVDEEELDD